MVTAKGEPERGVEPLAYSLRVNCSTTELLRRDTRILGDVQVQSEIVPG
jgi:hypothetical protein